MTYRTLPEMPVVLRTAVKAAIEGEYANPRRGPWPQVAQRLNTRFSTDMTAKNLRDLYSLWRKKGNAEAPLDITIPPPAEPEEELQRLLRDKAAEFLSEHRPLTPVPENIRTNRQEDMGYDSPIEAVIPFHDYHYGSKIDPRANGGFAFYNIDVARERLTRWRNLLLRFTQREQLVTTLENAHFLALGDDFEGHGEMFGTQKLTMDESIGFQYLGFVDDVSAVLLSLLERYKHITVYKVHGNHGRITKSARDSYAPDNIELMAWQNIADRVRASTGGEWQEMTDGGVRILKGGMIDFYIASAPRMLAKIQGFKFILMHGHGMKGIQSTYTGAMASKLAWNSIVGETINYMVKAHLHEAQQAEHEIGGAIVQGGCFVGPSDFSINMSRPMASLPSQELFFMHPKHGKIHHETLHLASVEELRQYVAWVDAGYPAI